MEKNSRFNKWNKWLELIYKEITDLSVKRYIFWEVQEIIKNNQKIQKPSAFYEFLGNCYVSSAVMTIRRQVKFGKGSISFARLLQEICDTPEVLSRDRYVALYKGSGSECFADRDFDKFAGKGKENVDSLLVKFDLEKFRKKANGCEKYADKRIAHFDKKMPKRVPTFDELDTCIDLLESLIKKYYQLFRGGSLVSVLPTFQYDWKQIFREPWLTS